MHIGMIDLRLWSQRSISHLGGNETMPHPSIPTLRHTVPTRSNTLYLIYYTLYVASLTGLASQTQKSSLSLQWSVCIHLIYIYDPDHVWARKKILELQPFPEIETIALRVYASYNMDKHQKRIRDRTILPRLAMRYFLYSGRVERGSQRDRLHWL